ncbi:MFS general substrate transporter [Bimuria novae-zelandiae CBS 107.79]|uniref:MFS general substrate transporter n=1 Tax=Bimuria novae-zelandiae CBS 107.79 TaxID=1447943 RepID=A0A6A5V6A8_9PLEO|nr:MFS general substrate transporter [Bimuria novae-zelandiae CBS 107.79]
MTAEPSRAPAVLAVSAATLACCSVFVFFRLISRFAIVRKPGWDDYTIILAWILAFGTSFAICWGTTKGFGRHQGTVPPNDVIPMNKAAYAFSVLYNPALMATKSSILIFYLTLSKTNKVFRWATIATMVVVNVGGLALTLLNVLQCDPVSAAFYTPTPPPATCINIVTIYLSSAPLNIITDLAIFFLPMPLLTAMRLPRKQKIILVITFGFGVFVAVVDVIRIYYLQDAQRYTLRAKQSGANVDDSNQRNDTDFSWYASFSSMWSVVEINIGIMCACVPALKPLVRRFLPKWVLDQTFVDKSTSRTSDSMVIPTNIVSTTRQSNIPSPPVSPTTTRPPPAFGGTDEPMGMMDFLTTPDMDGMPAVYRNDTIATTTRARRGSSAYFDFVDMQKKKNITLRTNDEAVYPVAMVTILFFIWGFAYGLLDTLNSQFQLVAHMSDGQTVGQHSAYYVGYLVAPFTFGRLVFRHWGFKACYIVGLIVYACGALVFWPSAVLTSFPAFLISNFIVGMGLSTLELSANPFIALCGPPEYAEARLCMSQGIQAIGTIVSPLLAKKVLFKASADSLIDVQWAYLGISFFTIILAIVFFYVPLPEATDEELENATARLPVPRDATIGSTNISIVWISLGMGVFSMFCYVGGQESTSTTFAEYLREWAPSLDVVSFQAIEHTGFAVSRLIAAVACIWIKPRFVLAFFFAGVIAFAAAAIFGGVGGVGVAIIVMVKFFEGPLFPLIYAQSLRSLGKHTKDAAVLLTAAIGGGAVWPPIMYAAYRTHSVHYAFCVVVAAYAAGALFPLWLNFPIPSAQRKLADPCRDEQSRRESEVERERRASMGMSEKHKRWNRLKNRLSREKDQLPTVEHRERNSWSEGLAPTFSHTHPAAALRLQAQQRHDSSQIETPVFLSSRNSTSSSAGSSSTSSVEVANEKTSLGNLHDSPQALDFAGRRDSNPTSESDSGIDRSSHVEVTATGSARHVSSEAVYASPMRSQNDPSVSWAG